MILLKNLSMKENFWFCENERLSAKKIRKYRIKRYIVYYVIDEERSVVNVLRVRRSLQDENKFFNN